MATTATTATPSRSMTRMRRGRPATANMINRTIIMMMAVPRSGCFKTSTIGMPAMIKSLKTSFQASPSSVRRSQ